MEIKEKCIATKRIRIYLSITLGFIFCFGILAALLPEDISKSVYALLVTIFTPLPLIATWITRKITKDTSPWNVSLKVWHNWRMWIFSALVPTLTIFLGVIVFYFVFPNDLDFSGTFIVQNFSQFGAPTEISFSISSMLTMGVLLVIISAFAIPIQLLELGEEIGWRGYLLPLLLEKMTVRKAILVNGILWGIAHAPLIYFGFNYGLDYIGAPFTGIAMMTIVCTVFGILECYVMLKTGNCMYSAILHGAMNVIGETGVWVSLSSKSPLLGPNPTGMVSISVTVLVAALLFIQIKNDKPQQWSYPETNSKITAGF